MTPTQHQRPGLAQAFRRPATAIGAAFCLLGLLLAGGLRADDEEKKPDLPPEVAGKVKNFIKKINDAQRKRLDEKMDKLIAEIAKATALKDDGVKALKAAAAKAEDAEQSEMNEIALKSFAKEYADNGEAALAPLEQPEVIEMATNEDIPDGPGGEWTRAADQPAWKNALAKTLTPEQAAAWDKSKQPDEGAAKKAVNAYLDTQEDAFRAQAGSTISTLADDIISTLSLSKERADAVNALVKKATDSAVAAIRKSTGEALLKYDKNTRDRILNGRGGYSVGNSEGTAEKQAIWKDGIAKLLTDAERAQLKTAAEFHRERRAEALGMLMVQMVDEKVAFSQEQRAKIQPLADRAIKNQKSLFPDKGENNFYRYEKPTFYKTTKDIKADEVRPLLDDAQWKHWQELASLPNTDDDENPRPNQLASKDKEPPGPGEPEDLEAAVAAYLVAQGDTQFKQYSENMLLQVEDARRVAKIGAGAAARLRTAALGTAESLTGTWMSNIESNLRGELQGATAENIQQKLAGMSRYSYMRVDLDGSPIWKTTLNTELSPDQLKVWQTERDEREAYKSQAIAAFLAAELDRKVVLTKAQWDKLAPILVGTIQEYGPDIRTMFSYNNNYAWYLQSYTLYMPLHAIQDKDLKEILSPAQFTAWTGSQECTYSNNYWENVRSNHDRRVKQKKG